MKVTKLYVYVNGEIFQHEYTADGMIHGHTDGFHGL